jgi:hypothetical protein
VEVDVPVSLRDDLHLLLECDAGLVLDDAGRGQVDKSHGCPPTQSGKFKMWGSAGEARKAI